MLMSHFEGTANGTASTITWAMCCASSSVFTEQSNSSCTMIIGVTPCWWRSTMACLHMSAALAWINRLSAL